MGASCLFPSVPIEQNVGQAEKQLPFELTGGQCWLEDIPCKIPLPPSYTEKGDFSQPICMQPLTFFFSLPLERVQTATPLLLYSGLILSNSRRCQNSLARTSPVSLCPYRNLNQMSWKEDTTFPRAEADKTAHLRHSQALWPSSDLRFMSWLFLPLLNNDEVAWSRPWGCISHLKRDV